MKVLWGGLAWLFTCVASCSFASDLDANFKFGLAFALVLIVLLCLLRHRRRGHLRCCVFCFCYGAVFFFLLRQVCIDLCCHLVEILPRHFFWKWKITTLKIFLIFIRYRCFFYFCALLYRCDVATYDLLKKWKKTNWTIFHKMGSQSLYLRHPSSETTKSSQ